VRIGLTGGIASGKSTVTRELERLGAVVLDADILARDVVALGTDGLRAVVSRFGESVLAADQSLDRRALGRIVFADPKARADLNAIVHPLVRDRAAEMEAAAPEGAIVVHAIPLLVETGQQDRFDAVVVVDTTVEEQLRRLTRRDGLTMAEAKQRVAAQASREERLRAATHVIDSSGPVQDTMRQVRQLWQELNGPSASRY
jgi:dephospho-coA kinase